MLSLYTEDVDAVIAAALAKGARQTRPMEEQFYGDRASLGGQFDGRLAHDLGEVLDLRGELLLTGSDRTAASAVLPASRNSAFQRPIDCSEIGSNTDNTDKADNTVRVLTSAENTAGPPLAHLLA